MPVLSGMLWFLRAANAPYPFMGTGSVFVLHYLYTIMVFDDMYITWGLT